MGLGESYRQALALAREELGRWSGAELEKRLAASGARWLPAGQVAEPEPGSGGTAARAIGLSFLGRPLVVTVPDGRVDFLPGASAGAPDAPALEAAPGAEVGGRVASVTGAEAPQWLAILTLHYLNGAGGDPLRGELIPFRDLPGGRVYDANFEKRVRARLVRRYAHQPALLVEAGKRLGGEAADMGDAAVRLLPFPRVPVWMVLWAADEEFPAQANVLFDGSVGSYLCTEDVVVLCEQMVAEMINLSRKEVGR
ncbi:MAG: DUF3786 domain-containing protein [Bacillota bacterium]|nr:DUF3786 domain-containing protein [Bacillota bacterium]